MLMGTEVVLIEEKVLMVYLKG